MDIKFTFDCKKNGMKTIDEINECVLLNKHKLALLFN